MRPLVFAVLALLAGFDSVRAQSTVDYPVYVTDLANPNDYTIFANAGWDGNWYVGHDTAWVKKLPVIPPGQYKRAFLGARVGRAKLEVTGKRASDRRPIRGELFMAISATAAWKPSQYVRLTETSAIPAEGDFENPITLAGESQWFWAEIPVTSVQPKGDNFIALWSPTPAFVAASSSPILAAGWGSKSVSTWLMRGLKGSPPQTPGDLGAGISYFQPALALKLIPDGPPHPLQVNVLSWRQGDAEHPSPVLVVDAAGPSVERVWVEASQKGEWRRVGRPLWKAPYIFTLAVEELPPGRVQLRAVAANVWEDQAASRPLNIQVSTPKR
jgi:hypothetical protein